MAENTHEPIIDRVLFDEVQEIIEQASADVKRRIRNVFPEEEREENILIGHVKCGCCGKALVLKGIKRRKIAATLNREGIPTPAVYRKLKGCTRDWFPEGKKAGWTSMMIADIIRDERYAGHMVSHKTAYVDNERRKQMILPKEQWIIVRNTHEGIVTDEEFALANSKMKKVSRTREYKGVDKGAFSVNVDKHMARKGGWIGY